MKINNISCEIYIYNSGFNFSKYSLYFNIYWLTYICFWKIFLLDSSSNRWRYEIIKMLKVDRYVNL